nr:MAG TPA: putative periplasmic lipoprotein [Caudoviricetes sp.]
MEKIFIKNLKGNDKLLHSICGNIIFVVSFLIAWLCYSLWEALVIAICVVLLVGLAKELYDKYIKKTFIDWWDIVASLTPYPIVKRINEKR